MDDDGAMTLDGRRLSPEEMYPLKRKRDNSLTPWERQRAREEGLRLETRARRKRELLELRSENEQLKEQRAEFLEKIQELEKESLEQLSTLDPHLASENDMLRAQIEEHKRFVSRFTALSAAQPSQRGREEVIYREGAEAAQAYVASLVSQSQAHWLRVRIPECLAEVGAVQNVQMSYRFSSECFGEREQGVRSRLNLRFDCLVRGMNKAEVVADVFWRAFSKQETQQRLYKTSGIVLKPVEGSMPDENTRVVHFTRSFPEGGPSGQHAADQDVVFVVNRVRNVLAKSTLTPPRQTPTGKGNSKCVYPLEDFGKVSAITVATTSTTLYTEASLAEGDKDRVKALVVKGATIWAEEEGTRLLVVYSVPDSYKVVNAIGFDDIVNERGAMSRRFARLVEEAAREFTGILGEEAELVQRGAIGQDEIDVHLAVPSCDDVLGEAAAKRAVARASQALASTSPLSHPSLADPNEGLVPPRR